MAAVSRVEPKRLEPHRPESMERQASARPVSQPAERALAASQLAERELAASRPLAVARTQESAPSEWDAAAEA
jgi:hypothetical protein